MPQEPEIMGIAAFPLGTCKQSSAPDLEGQGSAAHQWCCISWATGVLNQQGTGRITWSERVYTPNYANGIISIFKNGAHTEAAS